MFWDASLLNPQAEEEWKEKISEGTAGADTKKGRKKTRTEKIEEEKD